MGQKAEIKRGADRYGGEDNPADFRMSDQLPYYDKGGHKERSLADAPQHREHWKKEEAKKYEQ